MADLGYPAGRHDYDDDAEELERVEGAMDAGPKGALAVSGIAVALLLLGWFFVYLFIFLPRGTVG
jgi:hypothetical protein